MLILGLSLLGEPGGLQNKYRAYHLQGSSNKGMHTKLGSTNQKTSWEQEQSSTQLSDMETHGLLLVQGNAFFCFFMWPHSCLLRLVMFHRSYAY